MPEQKPKQSVQKRIVNISNSILDVLSFFIFLSFFLIGLYAMYDSYKVYENANDKSLLKYKPGSSQEETSEKMPEITDMIAWITMEGTPIDYPVMQGADNSEYLNKDPYGNYSLSGSIFLDSRNDKDFTDSYSLLYGHHMDHDYMFGALDLYLDEDFFNKNKSGVLTVGDTIYNLKTFSVVETTATNQEIFAPTENDGTIDFIKKNSLYLDELPDANTKILGLSTCKFPGTTYRTIVFCTMTWDENSKEPPKKKREKKIEKEKHTDNKENNEKNETVVQYTSGEVETPVQTDELEDLSNNIISKSELNRVDGNTVIVQQNSVLEQELDQVVAAR